MSLWCSASALFRSSNVRLVAGLAPVRRPPARWPQTLLTWGFLYPEVGRVARVHGKRAGAARPSHQDSRESPHPADEGIRRPSTLKPPCSPSTLTRIKFDQDQADRQCRAGRVTRRGVGHEQQRYPHGSGQVKTGVVQRLTTGPPRPRTEIDNRLGALTPPTPTSHVTKCLINARRPRIQTPHRFTQTAHLSRITAGGRHGKVTPNPFETPYGYDPITFVW